MEQESYFSTRLLYIKVRNQSQSLSLPPSLTSFWPFPVKSSSVREQTLSPVTYEQDQIIQHPDGKRVHWFWWSFNFLAILLLSVEIHMDYIIKYLFVCLFGFLSPTLEFFTHMESSPFNTCDGFQILTYTRHSWPLSSEGSLACNSIEYKYEMRGCIW